MHPPCCDPQTYQYYWLVDPLDGTKEFLKRNGEFTVNIALMQGDTPVMGVVHVPVSGKTYWAVQGKGAWLRTTKPTPTQRRIECAEFGLEDPKLKVGGWVVGRCELAGSG